MPPNFSQGESSFQNVFFAKIFVSQIDRKEASSGKTRFDSVHLLERMFYHFLLPSTNLIQSFCFRLPDLIKEIVVKDEQSKQKVISKLLGQAENSNLNCLFQENEDKVESLVRSRIKLFECKNFQT